MEKFNQGAPRVKVTLEDIPKFGKLLSKRRNELGKSVSKIASTFLGIKVPAIAKWERGEAFPDEDKLPLLSEAYNIDLQELIKVLEISKEARQMEKDSRKEAKGIKPKRQYQFGEL